VSIFGSARTAPQTPYYQLTSRIASGLVEAGYAIITGGGPGNHGSGQQGGGGGGGVSIGLNIDLPMEQTPNPHTNLPLFFKYFFVRKVMFIKYAMALSACPGVWHLLTSFLRP